MLNIKKIKPLFSNIVTTANKWTADELDGTGLVTDIRKQVGTLKDFQTVVAVGDFVKNIKEGDLVCIDPSNYAIRKFREDSIKKDLMKNDEVSYNFNIVELNGIPHLMLNDRDIRYVIEEYEDVKSSPIIKPNSDIIFA